MMRHSIAPSRPSCSASLRTAALVFAISSTIGNYRAEAQSAANVLVITNRSSAASETVSRAYIARRGISQANVCGIVTPETESISRGAYENDIEAPIWRCIAAAGAQDRILYIVLTKGVPLRISGTGGRAGTNASVDSELTLLYRRGTGQVAPIAGFVPNPYFAGVAPIASLKPFSHQAHDIYLVTRLDGYTVQDALGLIDKAAAAVSEGRFVLDERSALVDSGGDRWLRRAAERLRAQGVGERVVLDESAQMLTKQTSVLGYYSWGSNDSAIRTRHLEMTFVPGALAGMFVSTDGRTFKEPPPTWTPSDDAKNGVFGGSHQSLMADLIREGVTGASGHVDEPFLDATIRPDILFPAYVSGRNLAESYYAAMPYLSWQTIIVGDPLCAPFPHKPLDGRDVDSGLDEGTGLPALFSRRRLEHVTASLNRAAAIAYVRAEGRKLRKDEAGAREALEAAVAAEPHFTMVRLELATMDDRDQQFDRAIGQYRAILAYSPNDAAALNNLAYDLSVHAGKADEALPLAERACAIVKDNPLFLDTLAWIQHLLKRDPEAVVTMRRARSGGSQNPELLWHAAVIYAAVNDLPQAAAELNLALKVKPDLAELDEVKRVRQRLTPGK
ncbi:MAG: putative system TPR-repeat lipoprotein [Acidobacteria bacterium]|nr:putative system TPR-repeat lipoprotein [Acidobacteriota bacterium]